MKRELPILVISLKARPIFFLGQVNFQGHVKFQIKSKAKLNVRSKVSLQGHLRPSHASESRPIFRLRPTCRFKRYAIYYAWSMQSYKIYHQYKIKRQKRNKQPTDEHRIYDHSLEFIGMALTIKVMKALKSSTF